MCFGSKMSRWFFENRWGITSIQGFHLVICSNISFSWNMICWEPYISIYTASTFFKSSYIKTLISLHSCSISYDLSQGVLRRTKYSSGGFSVLTANLICSLPIGLIEQGIVSNYQSNSPITSLFIYLFIQNYQHSLLITKCYLFLEFCDVVFWFMQLEKLKKLMQYQILINDLLGVGLDEFIYLFIYWLMQT